MPLDSIGPIVRSKTDDLLTNARIIPINEVLLAAYKKREAALNPGDRMYRYAKLIRTVVSCVGMIALICAVSALGSIIYNTIWWNFNNFFLSSITMIGFAVIFIGFVVFDIKVGDRSYKGPARWKEDHFEPLNTGHCALLLKRHEVPEQIRSLVHQMMSQGDIKIVIGKLIQDERNLDPYLLASALADNNYACLGVWKNGRTLHLATTY